MKLNEIAVDDKHAYIERVKERGAYFRRVQLWHHSKGPNYDGWLSNFTTADDRYLAARILNCFLYYSDSLVDKLLHDAIGSAVATIAQRIGVTDRNFYKTKIIYSYITGEVPKPTDSGYLFMRKLRDALDISDDFMSFPGSQLMSKLCKDSSRKIVLFSDDIVGSGNQCIKALRERIQGEVGMPLYEYAVKCGHVLAYAPLISHELGASRICNAMPDLIFTPEHVLGSHYNLFNRECLCWEGDADLYLAGMDLINRVCEQLGINDNDKEVSMKGFNAQGLCLGFEHGIPDACSAIFFYKQKGWIPLMERYYERG